MCVCGRGGEVGHKCVTSPKPFLFIPMGPQFCVCACVFVLAFMYVQEDRAQRAPCWPSLQVKDNVFVCIP